jgi:hypothetical protein
MKHFTATTLFALASLVAVGSMSAQDHVVQANIPFGFTVGSKALPPGTYVITAETPHVIVIRNKSTNAAALSAAYGAGNETENGKLVFNRYGDQYFLSEVLCSSVDMSLKIPTSKVEKRAQLQEATLRNSDQVFLALK